MTPRKQSGFTLLEVITVVAIVGILAAIAIPRYVDYLLLSRRAEAFTVLAAVKISQISYQADHGCFSATIPNPPGAPSATPRPWNFAAPVFADPCDPVAKPFGSLGAVLTKSQFYYQYACAARPSDPAAGITTEFTCSALGDVDSDGIQAEFILCTDLAETGACPVVSPFGRASAFPLEIVRVTAEMF
ncbi:MAG: type IV pilin protein [Myxococcota bacterium]